MTESLAAELAPIRVNLIAAGSVHTSGVGASLDHRPSTRREPLETTVPTRETVSPGDIAALAVHLMTNTAITGETFEIDGGEQLVE
jgi:NAD(P)-dependent dehydrogenase (short-subunit alcohol dehydrogenase family)